MEVELFESYWIIRHQFHRNLFWSYLQGDNHPVWVSIAYAKTFNHEKKDALVVIPGSGIWVQMDD